MHVPARFCLESAQSQRNQNNALRAAPRPTDKIPVFRTDSQYNVPQGSFFLLLLTIIIRMENFRPITAIELQVENPISIFQFPTPTLEYLADTKQSDIYRSLGMDRRRKNLLVNSLYPAPGRKWSAYDGMQSRANHPPQGAQPKHVLERHRSVSEEEGGDPAL